MKRGQNVGYQSYLILLPGEGAGMVVMTNSDNGSILAEALDIHPFMLSKWRKQVRDGVLKGKPGPIDVSTVAELKRLRELEHKYKRLQVEHDILKKAIRFASELRKV